MAYEQLPCHRDNKDHQERMTKAMCFNCHNSFFTLLKSPDWLAAYEEKYYKVICGKCGYPHSQVEVSENTLKVREAILKKEVKPYKDAHRIG